MVLTRAWNSRLDPSAPMDKTKPMRALLGLLLLAGTFLAATGWQMNRSRSVKAAREQQHGLTGAPRDPAWSLLVLGPASGADPIPVAAAPAQAPAEPEWTSPPADLPLSPAPTSTHYAPDYRYVVQAGDVLSRICKQHYGTARSALVSAVAHYNGLPTPDAIRVGEAVLLPDRTRLEE